MSRIYVCKYGDGKITCEKIMTEENEETANRFAQKKAGGMSAKMDTHVIKDGSKIYTLVVFSSKDKEGYFVLQSNKPLSLSKDKIQEEFEKAPEEMKAILEKLIGKKLGNEDGNTEETSGEGNEKQESILHYCLGVVG